MAEKAGYRIPGPYRWEHIDTACLCVMTNTAPAGPFRGFGGTQTSWASESQIDMIARRLGIDPYDLRQRNLLRLGDPFVPGESGIDSDLREGLDLVCQEIGYHGRTHDTTGTVRRGMGIAIGFKDGGGVNKPAQARVKVSTSGDVFLQCGTVEIGQGARTALSQITAEILGVPLDKVKALKPDLFLVSGHESTAMTVISQIEQAGADVPMVASTHCVKARLALERKGSSQLLFCPVQWNKSARYKGALFGTGKDFTRLYTSVYGYEPSPESAQAAAAVYVFADAFKRAQSLEPEKVRDAISTTNLLTFFGPIKFDDRGVNSSKPMLLTQIVDGDFVLVAPQNWAEREPVIKKAKP